MSGPRYYRFGDFRFDPVRRILERDQALVALPPKVLDTLAVLLDAAPGVVDRETLFKRLWPDTHVVESSLTKNISLLRKALGDEDGSAFIETLSKRGYRFAAPFTIESPAVAQAPARAPHPVRLWFAAAGAVALIAFVASFSGVPSGSGELSESHRQYLLGRHHWSKASPLTAEKALARFEAAIRLDPNHALAYAGRSDALVNLAGFGLRNAHSAAAESLRSARQAVSRNPQSDEARAAFALARLVNDFDWSGAESEYRRAIAINPRASRAYFGLSRLLAQTGRLPEAKAAIAVAQRLDPVSPLIAVRAAYIDYLEGNLDLARRNLLAVLDIEPGYSGAHYYLSLIYAYQGDLERSAHHLAASRVAARTAGIDSAWAQAHNGDPSAAQSLLVEFDNLKRERRLGRSAGAILMVATGRFDDAIAAMHAAIDDRESWALDIACDPRFRPLSTHPGYSKVIRHLRSGALN